MERLLRNCTCQEHGENSFTFSCYSVWISSGFGSLSCVLLWTEFSCPVSSHLLSISLNLMIASTLGKHWKEREQGCGTAYTLANLSPSLRTQRACFTQMYCSAELSGIICRYSQGFLWWVPTDIFLGKAVQEAVFWKWPFSKILHLLELPVGSEEVKMHSIAQD